MGNCNRRRRGQPGQGLPHLGIVHNTISNNKSTHNGYQVPGAGAGVGIFSDGSGIGLVTKNIVVNNELTHNGIPGVAFHSHVGPNFGAPADDLNNNLILSNHISGNGADVGDTPTSGPISTTLKATLTATAMRAALTGVAVSPRAWKLAIRLRISTTGNSPTL